MSRRGWLSINQDIKNKAATRFNSKILLNSDGINLLCSYLMAPDFIPSLFTDPNNWVTNLMMFPFNVAYNMTEVDSEGEVIIPENYYLNVGIFKTNVPCYIMSDGYSWFDMGEYHITREFGNFADFNGYTKVQVWLPYYGFVEVPPSDVMDKYLEFALSVDYNTGQAVYYIAVSDESIDRGDETIFASTKFERCRVISTHTFQLGYQLPLGSTSLSEMYRNIVGGIVKVGAVIGGAAVAGKMGAGIAATTTTTIHNSSGTFTRTSPSTGRKISPGTWTKSSAETKETVSDSSSYLKGRAVMDTFEIGAQTLASMQVNAQCDIVNNPAILSNGPDSIYVIIKTPRYLPIDDTYKHDFGVPLGETRTLGEISGYTEIGEVHIEGEAFSSATSEELARLNETLVSGIIL